MSAQKSPHLEGQPHTTTRPRPAETASGTNGRSAPEDVARQGVLSALRSNQHQQTGSWGDGRVPLAWLHIVAPPSGRAVPTATSKCACGRDRSAVGRARVQELIEQHEHHRQTCPLLGGNETEGRKAA